MHNKSLKKLVVLLGIDGAGKSTIVHAHNQIDSWMTLSYDRGQIERTNPELSLVDSAMREFARNHFTGADALIQQMIYHFFITYVTGQLKTHLPEQNILCNSYYFKFLAKDCLVNGEQQNIHNTWRSLYQPDKIIFLDTDPEVVWNRLQEHSEKLYPNEYEGETLTKEDLSHFRIN